MIKKQKGIGFIEVLVATVIVAVGLLALASMQGNFYSSSGESKARSEAIVLAEQKMEEFRNNVVEGNYAAITSLAEADAESSTGKNTSFSRYWTVTEVTGPVRKQVVISIAWDDGNVEIESEIAFIDPADSVALSAFGDGSTGGQGKAPGPGNNASESVTATVDLFDGDGNADTNRLTGVTDGPVAGLHELDGKIYRDDGNGKTGSLAVLCSGLVKFDIDLSYPGNYSSPSSPAVEGNPYSPDTYNKQTGSYTSSIASENQAFLYTKRFIENGFEIIQLYSQHYTSTTSGNTITYTHHPYCISEHRYYGGLIIPIKGEIHTEFLLDDIKIDLNKEDMFCSYNHGEGHTVRPYACYAGGDCSNVTGSETPNATNCSETATTTRHEVRAGGFRGNVGPLNIDDDGAGKESVCFKDDLDGTSVGFFTARKYKTLNTKTLVADDGTSSVKVLEEGLNKAYTCQDFYIVGRQANLDRLAAKCGSEVSPINLPPQQVIREIAGNNTVVTILDTTFCNARVDVNYTFTVTVSGTPTEVVTGSGAICTLNGASSYTCLVTTSASNMVVYASNDTQAGSCLISNLSSDDITRSCDGTTTDGEGNTVIAPDTGSVILSEPETYSLSGSLITDVNNFIMTIDADSFVGSPSCTFPTSTSFTCTISTFESSARIEVTTTSGRSSDSCNQNDLGFIREEDGSIKTSYTEVCTLIL